MRPILAACRLLIAGALLSAGVAIAQPAPTPAPAAAPAPMRMPPPGYEDPYAGKKRVLLIADTHTGNQNAHDAISHAMGTLERVARQAGIILYIRTDTEWITQQEVWGSGDYAKGGPRQARGRNLANFDAVIFYTNGETDMTSAQKADLLSWIRDGKGFVGIHTATATGAKWPEYGDMIGGYFDNHPWGITDAKVIVERPDFPGLSAYVAKPIVKDEHYAMTATPYSRDKVDVLARIDTGSVDMKNPNVHRSDGDFPVAWIKRYGTGRVFYSGLGHSDASWDDPRMQQMYLEAIKWAAGITSYPVRPHPLPAK